MPGRTRRMNDRTNPNDKEFSRREVCKLTYKINSLRYMYKNQSEDTMEEKTPFRIAMTPK